MRSRFALPLVLAVPGLGLAGAGLLHPPGLTYATSERWFVLHVAGIVFFPLVGVALALLVGLRNDPSAWLVRLTAFVYATFYSALDVVSGVGAGYLTHEAGPGPRPPEVQVLYSIGEPLGEVGSFALLACGLAITVDQVRRHGLIALFAVLLVVGAWLVHTDHIFSPNGVLGMSLLGVTTGAVATLEKLAGSRTQPSARSERHSG
jgi:hypothetical protein